MQRQRCDIVSWFRGGAVGRVLGDCAIVMLASGVLIRDFLCFKVVKLVMQDHQNNISMRCRALEPVGGMQDL